MSARLPRCPHDASHLASRSRTKQIWSCYINGQLANVGRAALWWSTFSILTITLLDSDLALAASRGAFNFALLFGAPLAVAIAERTPIRSLLIRTTTGRMLLWSILVPVTWIVFHNLYPSGKILWACLLSIMFFDGVAVAFANAVDIDCGGLDLLSLTYSLPITDYVRYRYTTMHQTVFDSSFIILTPPILLLLAYISINTEVTTRPDNSTLILLCGVACVFGLLSVVSLHYYRRLPPADKNDPPPPNQRTVPLTGTAGNHAIATNGIYRQKIGEVLDGLLIVIHNKPLKWRLISLATETALEDVMVSVIIPTIALNATPILLAKKQPDVTLAAFVSASVVAVGKLGGFIASTWLAGQWTGGGGRHSSQKLFNLVQISSACLAPLPIGYYVIQHPLIWGYTFPVYTGPIIIASAIFLFFVLSTAPKIGFASLIQNAIGPDDLEASVVFGFIGIFVTITDGLLIIATNLLFYYLGHESTETALCIIFSIYLLHGIIECRYGSAWIEQSMDNNP